MTVGILGLFGGVVFAAQEAAAPVADWFQAALGPDGQPDAWVYLAAPAAMFVTAVLPIPAEAPAMLNGVLFPPYLAVAVTWTFAFAGAAVSYEIARRFGPPIAVKLVGEGRFSSVAETVDRAGWPLLLGLRLAPFVAFTAVNWGAGAVSVRRRLFYTTTAVGIAPGAIAFTLAPVWIGRMLRGVSPMTVFVALSSVLIVLAGVRALRRTADEAQSSGSGIKSDSSGGSEK